jgi:4a-hydroxytetrahydrobiopterin dehydratase
MTALLDDTTVHDWLDQHEAWTQSGGEIKRTVECASFPAAIALVQRIAEVAEDRDHHPDIDIRWRTLHLALSTHSAGGLTRNDLDLAEEIDRLVDAAATA